MVPESPQMRAGMSPQMLLDSPNVVCECGSKLFHEAIVLKKVSALISPTGKEELYPIPVYVCDKCGKIPEDLTSKANASKILGEDTTDKKSDEKSNSLIV